MEKWYVIQVRTGSEEKIKQLCEFQISKKYLKECFIPKYTRLKKVNGKWEEVYKTLFSGYLFMISEDIDQLFVSLKEIPDLTKMLGKHGTDIYPLNEDEVVFLKSFGKEEHIVDMSIGYIEGEKIFVTNGPLVGKEGLIKKIDRHKRIAYIEVEFFGQSIDAKVGLEIIGKD